MKNFCLYCHHPVDSSFQCTNMICKNSKSVIAVYSANVNLTKETSNYQDNNNKKFEKEAFDSLDYNKKKLQS